LLLFFKKEVLFFFEKKNQKTFICFVPGPNVHLRGLVGCL